MGWQVFAEGQQQFLLGGSRFIVQFDGDVGPGQRLQRVAGGNGPPKLLDQEDGRVVGRAATEAADVVNEGDCAGDNDFHTLLVGRFGKSPRFSPSTI